ncbi:hypothetical protein IW140_006128 [Coemansia sp. RSA 1813]|nr:hypothetical protein EV178_006133 [Coemansia sp. RSA 1646]KAJ1766798.1 hypothetical protein LPJ74_005704 [Coemansia sp. RSA 1843]KAJ2085809.1 hypothetical protein IW138_006097 [Coemansia sp. RSA 986]KAJ2212811.1 hypothetical protein EV179_004378 [Coemansia sp. RSA 487]KAJ2563391.1 hypothetical protein IW140_006128 [Coemansia sp. RSA 1813]
MLTTQQMNPILPQVSVPSLETSLITPSAAACDTSNYKYAIISSDPAFNKTFKSKNRYSDDFISFRSSLPVYQCCYAVYTLVFVHQMKRKTVVIFYTWLPTDAPADERQEYLTNGPNMAKRLSHYDFHFVCTEWREFQQSVAIPKICKLLGP